MKSNINQNDWWRFIWRIKSNYVRLFQELSVHTCSAINCPFGNTSFHFLPLSYNVSIDTCDCMYFSISVYSLDTFHWFRITSGEAVELGCIDDDGGVLKYYYNKPKNPTPILTMAPYSRDWIALAMFWDIIKMSLILIPTATPIIQINSYTEIV